jgi:hypothetical protein
VATGRKNVGNVLKFGKGPVEKVDLDSIKETLPPRGNTLKSVLSWAWVIVRLPLFLVMYWLRMPITLVCNLISIPTLFAFLFCWYAFPIPKMLWGLGILSFTSFVLLWTYDYILLALSPQPMMRSL